MDPYENAIGCKHNVQEEVHKNHVVLMDATITVSVLTLNGILSKTKKAKSKIRSDSALRYSSSADEGASVVNAVVSFSKNVKDSETSISSHFPSLPLHQSIQHNGASRSNKQRLIASWPKEFDQMGNKVGTFSFERVLKFERLYNNCLKCVPEKVGLSIGLRKGSEMISLGSSSLIVMGNASHRVPLNLPVTSSANTKSWRSKPTCFTSDPNCKYSLDQNSCLKLVVNVQPKVRSIVSANMSVSQRGIQYSGSESIPSSRSGESTNSCGDSNETGTNGHTDSDIDIYEADNDSSVSVYANIGGSNGNYPTHCYTRNQPPTNHVESVSIKSSYSFDGSLYSSDIDYHVSKENDTNACNIPKPLLFCGGLMNLMNVENLDCQKSVKPASLRTLDKLKKKARNRSFKSLGVDVASVMPTYRQQDDNESQFIPPSKIYASDYAYDDGDSFYGERQDYHSVITEKLNNRSSSSD